MHTTVMMDNITQKEHHHEKSRKTRTESCKTPGTATGRNHYRRENKNQGNGVIWRQEMVSKKQIFEMPKKK